ncbi:urea carboxylase [Vibrio astriarenae]|nr:urea carboxylase [Vibrio sp. C7]
MFGVDLVEWMVRQGAEQLELKALGGNLTSQGHAIQVRLYAEDANKNFQPCAGLLSYVEWAEQDNLRIEHWIEAGVEVSPFFDPMLAKVIVHAADRDTALEELKQSLDNSTIYGIEHNKAYLSQLLASELVKKGEVLTQSLNSFDFKPNTFDVISGGTQTTIQDYPARTGYWDIGVPLLALWML